MTAERRWAAIEAEYHRTVALLLRGHRSRPAARRCPGPAALDRRCATPTSTRCPSSRSACSPAFGADGPGRPDAGASCASSSCRSTGWRPASRTPAEGVDHARPRGAHPGRRSPDRGGTWADIGAGTGAFTLALADLLGPGARILAVDRDAARCGEPRAVAARFPDVRLTTRRRGPHRSARPADARRPGRREQPPLRAASARPRSASLAEHLRPGAPFIVVEYDADRGNPWVPHPFSASDGRRWRGRPASSTPTEIGRVPSRFLGAIYARASPPSAATSRSTSDGRCSAGRARTRRDRCGGSSVARGRGTGKGHDRDLDPSSSKSSSGARRPRGR